MSGGTCTSDMYVFTQVICKGQDVIQHQFLNGEKPIAIRIFHSLRLVAEPKVKKKTNKKRVYLTIFSWG